MQERSFENVLPRFFFFTFKMTSSQTDHGEYSLSPLLEIGKIEISVYSRTRGVIAVK